MENDLVFVYVITEIQNRRVDFQYRRPVAEDEKCGTGNEVKADPVEEEDEKEIELGAPEDDEDFQLDLRRQQREQKGAEQRAHCEFFSEERVQARGGIEALEYDLGDDCHWFAPIGQVRIKPKRGGRIQPPLSTVQPLIDAWRACGTPKEFGWRAKGVELYREVRRASVDS
jgi:hypothetical protein